MGESVLEGKLKIRKQLSGKHKLGRLQVIEKSAKLAIGQTAYFLQQRERDIMSDDRRILQQSLLGFWQRVDTRGENACTVGGISFPEMGLVSL